MKTTKEIHLPENNLMNPTQKNPLLISPSKNKKAPKHRQKFWFLCFILLSFTEIALGNSVRQLSTPEGSVYGFSLQSSSGSNFFITSFEGTRLLTQIEVPHSKNSKNGSISASLVYQNEWEGYSIYELSDPLETDSTISFSLGDSDTVDRDDRVFLLGPKEEKEERKASQILFRATQWNDYFYSCFLLKGDWDLSDRGRPVLNSAGQLIGLFVSYKEQGLVIPLRFIQEKLYSLKQQDYNKEESIEEKVIWQPGQEPNPQAEPTVNPNSLIPIQEFSENPEYSFGEIADMDTDQKNHLYVLDKKYREIRRIPLEKLFTPQPIQTNETSNEISIEEKASQETPSDVELSFPPSSSSSSPSSPNSSEGTERIENRKGMDGIVEGIEETQIKKEANHSEVIRIFLEKPISLTVSRSGLIYVLDEGSKSIVFLNENLEVLARQSYRNSAEEINLIPKKIRAWGSEIYLISDTEQLYHLALEKKTGEFLLQPVMRRKSLPNERWSDLAYEGNQYYALDSAKKEIRILNERKRIIHSFSLSKMNWPSHIGVYKNEIFVLDQANKQISIYDPEGKLLRVWQKEILSSSGNAHFMRMSPNGFLALGYRYETHIRLFHSEGQLIETLSPFPEGSRDFPVSLTVSLGGIPSFVSGTNDFASYIQNTQNIQDKNTELENLGNESSSLGSSRSSSLENSLSISWKREKKWEKQIPFSRPISSALRGLVSDSQGRFWISDLLRNSVFLWEDQGPQNRGVDGFAFGELGQPIQLDYRNQNVYILDKENQNIVVLDDRGVLQKSFAVLGAGNLGDKPQSLYPQDLSVGEEAIWVLAENHVLQFDMNGELKQDFSLLKTIQDSSLGFSNENDTEKLYAKGIAWDSEERRLYVSDTYQDRILVYDDSGNLLSFFGKTGSTMDSFFMPWDLVWNNGELFILDRGNHRILRYGKSSTSTESQEQGKEEKEREEAIEQDEQKNAENQNLA